MKRLLLFVTFLILPLFANIDAQIEAIQKAPVSERFKLMNAFKKEIVKMRETERIDAMSRLQSITQSKHANKAFRELRSRTNVRQVKETQQVNERIENVQGTQTEENVEDSTEDSIENQVEESAENETEDQVENETEDHVENEVETETEDHVENEVQNETEEHVENETEEHIENETDDHEDEHDDD